MPLEESWKTEGKTCEYCAGMKHPVESCGHFRGGKTKHEHKTGAHTNRFANREQRRAWAADANADNKNFPRSSCNGQSNRFHV